MRLYVGIGITYTALASVFDEEIYRRIPRHSAQCLILIRLYILQQFLEMVLDIDALWGRTHIFCVMIL